MSAKLKKKSTRTRKTSDKQVKANQKNASKSTGPRTAQGKAISRYNPTTHGLRSQQIIVGSEDPAEFEQRLHDFHRDHQPSDTFEAKLLHDFVVASWRLDRSIKADTAILNEKVITSYDVFDLDDDDRLRELIRTLPSNPRHVSRELRGFTKGCEWAIGELEYLLVVLEKREFWFPTERDRALHVLGLRTEDIFYNSLAFDIVHAFLGAGWATDGDLLRVQALIRTPAPEGMATWEYRNRVDGLARVTKDADPVESRVKLVELLTIELDYLKTRRIAVKQQGTLIRAGAADRASVDVSPSGQVRMRYETNHRRAYRNTLKDLMDYRKSKANKEIDHVESVVAPPPPPPRLRAPSEPISSPRDEKSEYAKVTLGRICGADDRVMPNLMGPMIYANGEVGQDVGPDYELLEGSPRIAANLRKFVAQNQALAHDFDYDKRVAMF